MDCLALDMDYKWHHTPVYFAKYLPFLNKKLLIGQNKLNLSKTHSSRTKSIHENFIHPRLVDFTMNAYHSYLFTPVTDGRVKNVNKETEAAPNGKKIYSSIINIDGSQTYFRSINEDEPCICNFLMLAQVASVIVIALCLSFFITAHAPSHVSESHYAHVTPFDAANATMILKSTKTWGNISVSL